jgi:predicted enzyme related to lactoylglutathione lyase
MHGQVSFVEIGTTDTDRTSAFFAKVFGWKFTPMDTGGGWFQAPTMRMGLHGNDPQPQLYVFLEVPDLDRAVASVRDAGGTAEDPGAEVPGFGRYANCKDPQGIVFGLHQRPGASPADGAP